MTSQSRTDSGSKALSEFGENDKELAQFRRSPSYMTDEDHHWQNNRHHLQLD
jgi:hypothetical protein